MGKRFCFYYDFPVLNGISYTLKTLLLLYVNKNLLEPHDRLIIGNLSA